MVSLDTWYQTSIDISKILAKIVIFVEWKIWVKILWICAFAHVLETNFFLKFDYITTFSIPFSFRFSNTLPDHPLYRVQGNSCCLGSSGWIHSNRSREWKYLEMVCQGKVVLLSFSLWLSVESPNLSTKWRNVCKKLLENSRPSSMQRHRNSTTRKFDQRKVELVFKWSLYERSLSDVKIQTANTVFDDEATGNLYQYCVYLLRLVILSNQQNHTQTRWMTCRKVLTKWCSSQHQKTISQNFSTAIRCKSWKSTKPIDRSTLHLYHLSEIK